MTDEAGKGLGRRKFLLGLAGFSLLSLKVPEAKAYVPFKPFTFAYVSDVHLITDQPDSFELTQESQLFLQELVKQLNQERVDFVMFGGDQVHTIGENQRNWGLFIDCLQPLNAAWSFVLGERDVSGPVPIDKNKTYAPDWKLLGINTETSYWSHNPKIVPDVHIIGLDTSLPNTTVGGISGRQLNWLKQDLEDNKKNFTMVFCHHPLLPPPPFDGGPPWDEYVIPDGGSVREVLGAHPQVKLVISGHVHTSKVQLEKDIWHISSPSLAVYPCAYRIFNVTPDMVTMETRQIDFPALVRKAKKELINSSLAGRFSAQNPASFVDLIEGDRVDSDALIPMKAGQQLQAYNPKKVKHVEEKEPEVAASKSPAVEEKEHKRGLFRRKKEDAPAAAQKTPVKAEENPLDDLPKEKPIDTKPIKDIDAELDKQLQLDKPKDK